MSQTISQRRWQLCLSVAVLCAGTLTSTAWGQGDPVDNLRKAFAVPKLLDDFGKRQGEQIKKAAGELHTLQQLRRAYFLPGWPTETDPNDAGKSIPHPVHIEIGERLVAEIKKAKDQAASAAAIPDESVRKVAQVRLLAVAMLIAELADSEQLSERKREKLARKLTDVVIELAGHPNVAVKQTALHALGKATPPPAKAFKVLQAQVRDKSEPGPRGVAAYAVIDLVKNAQNVPKEVVNREELLLTIHGALETALLGVDDPTAEEALRGYCLIAIREAARMLEELVQMPAFLAEKQVPPDLGKALAACEPVSVALSKSLQDPSPNIRNATLDALVHLGQLRARIVPNLHAKSPWPDPLGRAKLDEHIRQVALILVKPDVDPRERRAAVNFLDLLGVECRPALPEITHAMRDPDALVRYGAARTLRHFPYQPDKKTSGLPTETIEALGKLLLDGDPDVNSVAAASLEALGPQIGIAIESVSRGVTYGDVENRLAAMKLLTTLGNPTALRAYPSLVSALVHEDPRMKRQAAETLGQFGALAEREEAKADAGLRHLIDSFRAAAIPALTHSLRDIDPETRLNASEAILAVSPARKGL